MSNTWILHVKDYATKHNVSFKDALRNASLSYKQKGGSVSSSFVSKLIATDKFDMDKIKKPSEYLINKYPRKKVLTEVELFDFRSQELQNLIYITPINTIKKALVQMNYKGRMNSNKMLLNLQLLQNFKTINKIEELINLLK